MQRIYKTHLSPKEYKDGDGHRQVIAETVCPHCKQEPVHRHGTYARWISWLGQTLSILIARFLCSKCRRTVSYLPDFALSYRLVNTLTVQAFWEGHTQKPEVQSWLPVLQSYQERAQAFAKEVLRTVGWGLGLPPPKKPPLWPWLKKACGSLSSATRQLVSEFKISLFKRYQCHQPKPR